MDALPDAAAVAAAVHRLQVPGGDGGPDRVLAAARRTLARRARELGCSHLVPRGWAAPPRRPDRPLRAAAPPPTGPVPRDALLKAYMRGVRDYAMTSPHARPPIPRDAVARARAASLVRLAAGDPTARSDDADLIGGPVR